MEELNGHKNGRWENARIGALRQTECAILNKWAVYRHLRLRTRQYGTDWRATEYSATFAWFLNLNYGNMFNNTKATNRKRRTASAIVYEMNYESSLIALRDRINTRTYHPGKSI